MRVERLRIPEAKFFDPEGQRWLHITPSTYHADRHHGRLECPEMSCSGALSFIDAGMVNGNNEPRSAHFRTNSHGESHINGCQFEPDYRTSTVKTMQEALENNGDVLFNINFSCSYYIEKGRLTAEFARRNMSAYGGKYREDYIKENDYAPFSVTSVDKLFRLLKSFKNAAENAAQSYEDALEHLQISYLHGTVPWKGFRIVNGGTARYGAQTLTERFNILLNKLMKNPEEGFPWSDAPAVRRVNFAPAHLQFRKGYILGDTDNAQNTFTFAGSNYTLQDRIHVKDEDIYHSLKECSQCTIVATPYIRAEDIHQAMADERTVIPIRWPLRYPEQVFV